MQKKNNIHNLSNIKEKALSIQFNLDGFSFCVTNNSTKKEVYFKTYTFDKTCNSPIELLEKIEDIFKKDEQLQLDYISVLVIHQNNLATLVPNEFFNENALSLYLQHHVKTLQTDYITYDNLNDIQAKNVYIPYVNINNYLFQNFGEFEYRHHHTLLLNKILQLPKTNKTTVFVNVSKNEIAIFVLKESVLVFSNSFEYQTKVDFVYYILFVAEQLELDTEVFVLYFMGEIGVESETYQLTYKYVKNCRFLESNNPIFESLAIAKHTNYTLLGS